MTENLFCGCPVMIFQAKEYVRENKSNIKTHLSTFAFLYTSVEVMAHKISLWNGNKLILMSFY